MWFDILFFICNKAWDRDSWLVAMGKHIANVEDNIYNCIFIRIQSRYLWRITGNLKESTMTLVIHCDTAVYDIRSVHIFMVK